jgi:hypothetical protein
MNRKQIFFFLAASALTLTAVAKLIGAGGGAKVLKLRDPILSLSNQDAFTLAATVELVVAGYLFFGKNEQWKLLAIAWLSTNLLAYRLAMWSGNITRPCGCLGDVMDWWPWLKVHQDGVMKGLLAFMLVGAYGFLWHEWRAGKAKESLAGQHPGQNQGA